MRTRSDPAAAARGRTRRTKTTRATLAAILAAGATVLAALAVAPAAAQAQGDAPQPAAARQSTALPGAVTPAPHATSPGCTWETCALRVRGATFTSPPELVRGEQDAAVAPLAPFGPSVSPHFQRSDSAYVNALDYDRIQPVASVLNIVGPALLVVAPFLTNWRERPISSAVLVGGGFGTTILGTYLGNMATEALSRAVWWHNRALAEPPPRGASEGSS